MHVCRKKKKKKKTYPNKLCLHYDRTSFHTALSVKNFLAKTQVPAYTIWPFLMSHSLNGLVLNNARHSSNCHIIAESTVTKLFPVMLQDLTYISKGAKSECLLLRQPNLLQEKMFYLPDALNYLSHAINQARVQRTVFSPLKVTQSCPCTCHETTGGWRYTSIHS